VTTLVHDATMLGLTVDTARLFDKADPMYHTWLVALVERIYETRDRQRKAEERRAKSKQK
jgi:hypothetical protein